MISKILKYKKYIILSTFILIFSWLVVFYMDYYNRAQIEKSKLANEEIQKEAEKEKARKDELDKLKGEIESLKNRPSQTIIQNIAPKSNNGNPPSLAMVVKEWTPRIAQITCKYVLLPGTGGSLPKFSISTDPEYGAGSGFLMQIYDQKLQRTIVAVITNWHVLSGHNGFSPAETCKIKIGSYLYEVSGLDIGIRQISNADGSDEGSIEMIDGVPYKIWDPDAGYLIIENPAPEIRRLAQESAICPSKPQIGEDVVVLGFPAIGATQSITATNGIISGIDQRYYVTSAKIDHGNSGGATFWIRENCYIGIPTFALTGEIESLARILDIGYLFRN